MENIYAKNNVYTLSSAQRRIYYINSIYCSDSILAYNISKGILINKILDENKIKNAFNILINRHKILKTNFDFFDGEIKQFINKENDFKIKIFNKTNLDIKNAINNFPKKFDLKKDFLFRVEIYFINKKSTLILIDTHQIILDEFSLQNLIKEFCQIYNGKKLTKIKSDFSEYIKWENDFQKSEKINILDEFWKNNLKEVNNSSNLNLPYDYAITSNKSFLGDRIAKKINKNIINNLDKITKENDITLYDLFIGTFYILLYKYTSQNNIVIGTPNYSHYKNEFENLIGMFENNIVLNTKIDSNILIGDFFIQIKKVVKDGFENQPYFFDYLLKNLKIGTVNILKPIYNVYFKFANLENIEIDGTKIEIINSNTHTSKNDITINIDLNKKYIELEYAKELFKKETMREFLNNYINTLKFVINNKNKRIREVEIISKNEKNNLLYKFNNKEFEFDYENGISSLIEKQAKENPKKTAVVFNNKKLTYKELNERANKLARYLIKNKIKNQNIIGVCLNKNINFIITVLAIQKINCIYLPIYKNYSNEKINYMINNSNCNYLIVDELNDEINCKNIFNYNDLNFENESAENLNIKSSKNDGVYIIFTQGTTGNPKGIKVTQENLLNFLYGLNNFFENKINESDNCLTCSSISFDTNICEIFLPLINGAKLIIYPHDLLMDIPLLYDILKKEKITFCYLPPNKIEDIYKLIKINKEGIFLNKILIGSEPIKNQIINKLYEINNNIEIVNGYGTGETTIFVSLYKHEKSKNSNMTIPIGKPILNNNLYVMGIDDNLQPYGVIGELYVSGKNVTFGYVNDDGKNNENFIENPFDKNKICYKTGDLAFCDKNGIYHFVGKKEKVVKVKGFDIELNEIDLALRNIKYVKSSITTIQNINGINYICSYITTSKYITKEYIREQLDKLLPYYMIPAYIIFLKEMPINTNGKTDKKLLPLPMDFEISLEENNKKYDDIELEKNNDDNLLNEKKITVEDVNQILDYNFKNKFLLTSCTSYIENQILENLLLNCKEKIFCLINKNDELNNIKNYFNKKLNDVEKNKIKFIIGDVSNFEFGLSDKDYFLLGKKIDSVIYYKKSYNIFINKKSFLKTIDFCKQFNLNLIYISNKEIEKDELEILNLINKDKLKIKILK